MWSFARESRQSVKLTIWSFLVVPAAVCSCCENLDWMWYSCCKSLNCAWSNVTKAWIKHVVVAKAWIEHKLSWKPIHEGVDRGVGLSPLPPPYLPPPAPSLSERRALRARKIFLFSPPSLFVLPSPSSRPLFSLFPPPLLPPPAPSSPFSLPLFSENPAPSSPPSLLPCPPSHTCIL